MSLHALTVLARSEQTQPLVASVLGGRVQDAVSMAEDILSGIGPSVLPEHLCDIALLCGDLMVALDRIEEAEECYRRAVKLAATASRGLVRVVSCRSTGIECLRQHRFGTAAACFSRIAEDKAAEPRHKVEAQCALAIARHSLGQRDRAFQALDDASECASETGNADLETLVTLIRLDLQVQDEVRGHDDLRDHVFWQLPVHRPTQQPGGTATLAALQSAIAAHAKHELFSRRLQHLNDLVLASCGDVRALARLRDNLAWLRRSGLSACERGARIESALTAIANRHTEFARALLEPLQQRSTVNSQQRWNVELSYCLAKVCALDGRVDESMRHYQRYALESMQCVRVEYAVDSHPGSHGSGAGQEVKDDVEMRLPAKYRRAYRYMIEHLDRPNLSVREIAEHMAVTERALQSVFRSHLGMTPGEVVQRCRVERIRADLLRDDSPGFTVIETAARWGIRNRSTLISSYRKYFSETPGDTLARRGSETAVLQAEGGK